jgi:hypothetical protein
MINNINKSVFSDRFLSEFLDKGFGVLSKKEIDLLVFHLLSELSDLENESNYELALKLKISPTKLKNLRFERRLRYSQLNEEQIKNTFIESLKKSAIKVNKTSKWILLSIEDTFIREAIKAKLKELYQLSDSSFNSELITLDLEAFSILMEYYYKDVEGINSEEIVNYLKNKIENEDTKITAKHLFKVFIESAAQKAGEETIGKTLSFLTGGVSDFINIFEKIKKFGSVNLPD